MTQLTPDILAKQIDPYFIGKNDLVNRWGNVISSYMAIPGLRFFAPMSVIGATGQAVDLALQNSLTNNANPLFTLGNPNLISWCQYNGTTQYHSIADNAAHDIIGNEAYIAPVTQGLTIGMWIRVLSTSSNGRFFAKGASTGNVRAYSIRQNTTGQFLFDVSDNGTNVFAATDTSAFTLNQWYFLAGRFDPSTEVKLWRGTSDGLTTFTNTTSIPATINNSATGLGIGAQADGTLFSNIRASLCFVSCQYLDDYFIFSLFEQTRVLYGV